MKSILSTRLQECRKEKKLTQQALSDLIMEECDDEVPRTSIARYEAGTRVPDASTLSSIAFALNVDINYLLGKTDTKHQEAISEEVQSFINYINEVASNDDEQTNDFIWHILSNTESLIRSGITYGSLNQIEYFVNLLNSSLRMFYSHPVKNSLEELDIQLKKVFQLSWMESNKEDIEKVVSFVKRSFENPNRFDEVDNIFISSFKTQLLSYYDNPFIDKSEIPDDVKPLIEAIKNDRNL